MIKRLLKLLDDEDVPDDPIKKTIAELEKGIETIQRQLDQVTHTTQIYHHKLSGYQTQRATFLKQAQDLYRKNLETQALAPFKKVKILDAQIAQYGSLIRNVEDTRSTLFTRKNQLELKMDQLTSQLKLGEINADTSKLQAEVMENLMLLENSGEISKYQHMACEAESKYEAIQEIIGTEDPAYSSEPSPRTDLDELNSELNAVRTQASETSLSKAKKKYADFFEDKEVEDQSLADQKTTLLKQLKETVDTNETKLETFFGTSESPSNNTEQQDRIKDFFGE